MATSLRGLMKVWFVPEAIPIYGVVGVALAGCGYFMTRLALDPNNVYTNKNLYPWNEIDPTAYPRKFMIVNKDKIDKLREARAAGSLI